MDRQNRSRPRFHGSDIVRLVSKELTRLKLKGVVPMLTVTNIPASVAFYREVLGFACISEMEGWACVEKDGVQVMFAHPNQHATFEESHFTGSFYFKTNDVDELWEEVKDRARVLYPLETFEYGMREFAIHDNNGYLLQFGKEIE